MVHSQRAQGAQNITGCTLVFNSECIHLQNVRFGFTCVVLDSTVKSRYTYSICFLYNIHHTITGLPDMEADEERLYLSGLNSLLDLAHSVKGEAVYDSLQKERDVENAFINCPAGV